MKKSGFRASYAGAIEACASTGAVLARCDGSHRLRDRAVSQCQLCRRRDRGDHSSHSFTTSACSCRWTPTRPAWLKGIPRSDLPKVMDTIKDGWYYILSSPLLITCCCISSESHAPFYATALLLVLNQLFSRNPLDAVDDQQIPEVNGRTFVELVGILAGCGLLIGAFSMTGVVSSLANDLLRIAGDNAFLLLGMCAFTSLVLGLGLTTTACLHLPRHPGGAGTGKLASTDGGAHVHLLLGHAVARSRHRWRIALIRRQPDRGLTAMKTGWESMWVAASSYFIPLLRAEPALAARRQPYFEGSPDGAAAFGTLFICGGIRAYQAFVAPRNAG